MISQRSRRSRRRLVFAVTLVEILIASAILVVALIPLMTGGSAIHRQSHFTEFHAMAVIRARTVLDMVRSMDFDLLRQSATAVAHGAYPWSVVINVEALLAPGQFDALFTPLAPGARGSGALYQTKLRTIKQVVTYTQKSPDIGEIKVKVFWTNAADRDQRQPHEVTLKRLVHRREMTFAR